MGFVKINLQLILVALLCGLFSLHSIEGQVADKEILSATFDYSCIDKTIPEILLDLGQIAKQSMSFDAGYFDDRKKSVSVKNKTLEHILNLVLRNSGVEFMLSDGAISFRPKLILKKFRLSGFIEDADTGERLIGATIYSSERSIGAVTNEYGYFSLSATQGNLELEVSYLGYERGLVQLNLQQDERKSIELKPSITFEPVEVVASKLDSQSMLNNLSSNPKLMRRKLMELPALGGESDLFRYLQSQVGITSGSEGLSGLHVRGGNVDQNLILLDGIPIFNPSHALGLYSIFNTAIISSVRFERSGFSARNGGNLSSVLDVRSREANSNAFKANIGFSTVATNVLVEAPFKNKNGGVLLAARRTHLDPLIKRRTGNDKFFYNGIGESNFNFYDINFKANLRIRKNDRIYLSFYQGADSFYDWTSWDESYELNVSETQTYAFETTSIDWSNVIGSLRWNHLFGDRLFLNTTATISKFNYQNLTTYSANYLVENDSTEFLDNYSRFFSNILDYHLKLDFDYHLNIQHKVIWGASLLQRNFEPGSLSGDIRIVRDENTAFEDIVPDYIETEVFPVREFDFYIEDNIELSDVAQLTLGLHHSIFLGTEKTYSSLQPRLKLKYIFSENVQLELSGSRMTQYLHLLSASGAGLPNDLWVPSTERFGPQDAWEVSISSGIKMNKNWRFHTSVYYKVMNGLLAYAPSASLPTLADNDPDFWEDEVEVGAGKAFGWENQLRRTGDNNLLEINYAYSQSERTFEHLNDGFSYPFRYNRPHNLNLNYQYSFNSKWKVGLAWTIKSGQPISLITVPGFFSPLNTSTKLDFENLEGEINNYILPVYHKLDLDVNFTFSNKKHRLGLGVYNLYNRDNPIYAYEIQNEFTPEYNGIFFQSGLRIIPTVSYNWDIF